MSQNSQSNDELESPIEDVEYERLRRKAYDSLTRHLGARDHSEKELRKKLGVRYPSDIVERTIQIAKTNNWLAEPEIMANRLAERLLEKGKGSAYILRELEKKGLPSIRIESDREAQTARESAERKFGDLSTLSFDQKPKVMRFLVSRGFGYDIVQQVLFKKST